MTSMHSFDVVHGQYAHGIQLSVRSGIQFRKLFSEISAHDVTEAMNQMKTTKSVGIDKVSSYFLKLTMPYVSNSTASF